MCRFTECKRHNMVNTSTINTIFLWLLAKICDSAFSHLGPTSKAIYMALLIFESIHPSQPIENGGEAVKQEMRSYVKISLLNFREPCWECLQQHFWHNDNEFPWQLCPAGLLGPHITACSYILIHLFLLPSFFFCHWSVWQALDLYGKKFWNLAQCLGTVPWFIKSNFMSTPRAI